MSDIKSTVHFLSFEEWKRHREIKDLPPCKECDGTGVHSCNCGDTHDCLSCEGLGEDIIGLKMEYEKILKEQKHKLELVAGESNA